MPRIVERFPKYRDQVLRTLFLDVEFKDLCRDYDSVACALESEEKRLSQEGEHPQDSYRELVRLSRELENEILRRLAKDHNET
jgi:hypothetical protein